MPTSVCPLCHQSFETQSFGVGARSGTRCPVCDLVSIAAQEQLSLEDERERYLLHRNDSTDSGYLEFLARLADPVGRHHPPPARVLDFGSGPEPVLAKMLTDRGYAVTEYDIHFAPNPEALHQYYDLVVCCETVEHFRDPHAEWGNLVSCLNVRGMLGIMTLLHNEYTDWSSWWYARDATHVCFYSARTMEWIAEHFGLRLDVRDERVIFFQK